MVYFPMQQALQWGREFQPMVALLEVVPDNRVIPDHADAFEPLFRSVKCTLHMLLDTTHRRRDGTST